MMLGCNYSYDGRWLRQTLLQGVAADPLLRWLPQTGLPKSTILTQGTVCTARGPSRLGGVYFHAKLSVQIVSTHDCRSIAITDIQW